MLIFKDKNIFSHSKKIDVIFFQRKPYAFHKSIENIFLDVRNKMPDNIICSVKEFSYYSTGILSRLCIILEAFRSQKDVNHITGDIHFAAIGLKKNKTILTIHDCVMLHQSIGLKHVFLKLFWFTLPLRKCKFVTVVSQSTKNELLKYVKFPIDNIHIINVSISSSFKYHEKKFNNKLPIILQVGTAINKNLERLFEAIIGINCQLNIIGVLTKSQLTFLNKFSINYVNYTDLTEEEIVEQYCNCDIVSFVSTYEGFGMPIIEANAIGRVIITSNIFSMPEVAGNAAHLINPFDIGDIRTGFIKILNDEDYRERLIKNGLENCKRFDSQKIADSYLSLYKKIQYGHE